MPEQTADAVLNGTTSDNNGEAEENKFQKAISAWRAIDLTNLIPKLDTTASDLVANQKDSLVERKELAQKTKDFRKLDDTNKLVEIKAILKGSQVLYLWQQGRSPLSFQPIKPTSTMSQISPNPRPRPFSKCTLPYRRLPIHIRYWKHP